MANGSGFFEQREMAEDENSLFRQMRLLELICEPGQLALAQRSIKRFHPRMRLNRVFFEHRLRQPEMQMSWVILPTFERNIQPVQNNHFPSGYQIHTIVRIFDIELFDELISGISQAVIAYCVI